MNQEILDNISHGVYVIGVMDENNRPCGCIVDALLQATRTPLGIEVCTNKNSYTSSCINTSREFTVSILPVNADPKLIATFGLKSARDGINKWDGVESVILGGIPAVKNCLGSFKVKVFHKLELSTHILWSCEVIETQDGTQGTPLTYAFYRKNIGSLAQRALKGEDVKPYEEKAETKPQEEPKAQYACGVCGYIYDGDIPFEDLPDDWVCPHCGCGKEVFSKI